MSRLLMPGLPRLMRLPSAPQEWTRRKLQILLGVSVVVVVALFAGAAMSVAAMLRDDPPRSPTTAGHHRPVTASNENDLAAATLPSATLEDAQPGPLSTQTAGTITLPGSREIGPVGVPTGYPHTPAGALAQLIAIDRAAIEPAQVGRAQEVISAWAAPGGPDAQSWSGVRAVATLLSSAGFPATGAPEMQIRLEPAMGFIKGTVGEDFVIPCVDFVIIATTSTGAGEVNRIAAADCQRMVWQGDRWVIGSGEEPAPAPSLWPGSQGSIDAGYQWLEVD
jgi:hypothetical protein